MGGLPSFFYTSVAFNKPIYTEFPSTFFGCHIQMNYGIIFFVFNNYVCILYLVVSKWCKWRKNIYSYQKIHCIWSEGVTVATFKWKGGVESLLYNCCIYQFRNFPCFFTKIHYIQGGGIFLRCDCPRFWTGDWSGVPSPTPIYSFKNVPDVTKKCLLES